MKIKNNIIFNILKVVTIYTFLAQFAVAQNNTNVVRLAKKNARKLKKEGYMATDTIPLYKHLVRSYETEEKYNGNWSSFDSSRSFAIARNNAYYSLIQAQFERIPEYIDQGIKDQVFSSADTLVLMSWFRECYAVSNEIDPIINVWDEELKDSIGYNKIIGLWYRAEQLSLNDFESQMSALRKNVYPFDIYHDMVNQRQGIKGGNAGVVIINDERLLDEFNRYTWDLMEHPYFDKILSESKELNPYRAMNKWNLRKILNT